MSRHIRSPRRLGLVTGIGGALLTALLVATTAFGSPSSSNMAGLVASQTAAHKCVVMTGSGDPAFVRNFNPFVSTSTPAGAVVKGAIYEPLIITTNAGGGHTYPWLAQSWKWSNGNKTLTLNLPKNAKWSDGQPLTSLDVVYTLTAGHQSSVMDQISLTHPDTNVKSIEAKGKYAVVINLKTPDSTFIPVTLNGVFVIPQHIWSKVTDPSTFTDSNPVGSGPFDVVGAFSSQSYTLEKNPHYWQAGDPKVPCIQYVQAASNDAALALIQSGQVDWTHNFVPNAAQAYSSKDPKYFHYFYPVNTFAQSLVFDDTTYPYSIPAFRKAVSLAIDRQSVYKLGEYGYGPPADALGLNGLFSNWYTPALKKAAQAAAAYNPTAAKATLTAAGFTYKGNTLLDPKGNPVQLDIYVISGWSDWVASDQIIAKDLSAIGINSSEQLEPDWNSWYPNASTTKTPTLLWQNDAASTPFGYFNANLSQSQFTPSGQDATVTSNWAHFYDTASQPILNQFKSSLDPETQKADFVKLANLFLKDMPIVPIYLAPQWSTYSTKYFHGFSSPKNDYAQPIFTNYPDNILQFTRILPGGKAGA
ncbi:MAG TPA: ABC transporter substrate-binding protein [Gaiellaceae bacterium]|nr:ABC transporter substrate-binding protein [Gaiellaceae bacterium]